MKRNLRVITLCFYFVVFWFYFFEVAREHRRILNVAFSVFQSLDTDRSGILDLQELQMLILWFHQLLSANKVEFTDRELGEEIENFFVSARESRKQLSDFEAAVKKFFFYLF